MESCDILSLEFTLFSLNIIPWRFTHVIVCINSVFPFFAEQCFMIQMYHPFTHSLIEDHMGCFQFLDVMDKPAMIICV